MLIDGKLPCETVCLCHSTLWAQFHATENFMRHKYHHTWCVQHTHTHTPTDSLRTSHELSEKKKKSNFFLRRLCSVGFNGKIVSHIVVVVVAVCRTTCCRMNKNLLSMSPAPIHRPLITLRSQIAILHHCASIRIVSAVSFRSSSRIACLLMIFPSPDSVDRMWTVIISRFMPLSHFKCVSWLMEFRCTSDYPSLKSQAMCDCRTHKIHPFHFISIEITFEMEMVCHTHSKLTANTGEKWKWTQQQS